jgi:hypothetical protein
MKTSNDGNTWTALDEPMRLELPQNLKIGVVAESTANGTCKPEFDQFKLTPFCSKAR